LGWVGGDPTARTIDLAVGERHDGPILTRCAEHVQVHVAGPRHAAYIVVAFVAAS
jgi:hypothetical protein